MTSIVLATLAKDKQDVGNASRAEPDFPITGNSSSQLRHSLSILGVDRQTSSHLVNVCQQEVRVGICISCRLAVDKDPILWDPSTINTVFELEGHTPVILVIGEEEIGIVIFVFINQS
jgi:hypothetical protein